MDDPTTTNTEGFGLMYYNARWYDPSIGRFAQADTITPSDVQGPDRYAAMANNPIRYTDPSGHMKSECGGQDRSECGGYVHSKHIDLPKVCSGIACLVIPIATPGPTIGKNEKPGPEVKQGPPQLHISIPYIQVDVDWSQVDKIDALIDGIGLGADAVALGALVPALTPLLAPAVPFVETVGTVAEGAGFVKSGIELIQGNPKSMLQQQVISQSEKVLLMGARFERMAPGIGFVGNLVSLAINLKPQQPSIQWITVTP